MMIKTLNIYFIKIILISILTYNNVLASVVKKIEVMGNERISDETIMVFSEINKNLDIIDLDLNKLLKNLYETNFFEDVQIKIENQTLQITVKEYPIIEDIIFTGVKANKYLDEIKNNLQLKSRSSYNKFYLLEDKKKIESKLKNLGFYFSEVSTFVEKLEDNRVIIEYKIEMGDKAKIKKISFIGNKIFKENKLRSIIVSEEFKFWKFISGKKYLREDIIALDTRLLKNFYLNNGYYNVQINSSFAKLIKNNEFELIFNIDAKNKIFFNNLTILLPDDFNKENFSNLNNLLLSLKNKPYSLNEVNNILKEIDNVTILEEYKSIKASLIEKFEDDKLNINFEIKESEKYFVERINIYGNNVTRENVIRNQLVIDEGDPFNEILEKKSINNIKGLNFFKTVNSDVVEGSDPRTKIINIKVEEKPTGEIAAGAGLGSSGGTIGFSIKENNYLGKGLSVEAATTVTDESFKGLISISDPNYKNSDKSVYVNAQAIEIDRLKKSGYKNNKTGFEFGTDFEYLDNLKLGISTNSFIEKIETSSKASAKLKKQEGDYFDTFLKLRFDYDKRNQKFKPTDGYRSFYNIDVPVISDNNTLTNTYSYKTYSELYENNISSFSIFLQSANSISGDDIKLTERLFIPSQRLRGFERGKVGPKDGNDYIGGNYISTVNMSTTLPKIFENFQNLDANIFLDAANIWGIDYDSSLNDSSGLRSSVGIGFDYFTVIGPVNFSLAEVITKENSDKTESFRFTIGTTF